MPIELAGALVEAVPDMVSDLTEESKNKKFWRIFFKVIFYGVPVILGVYYLNDAYGFV
ncbi:MAG: hypothetical protein QF500_05440 [Candidatus Thalassarchaeaceae archaeon]|jgi:hypothetical protein|nr:hypothetical protein [Candidatus Thalassarchaeaceae archaeon]HJM30463.1 hypothetical protein [Candidatus Thalassarchaeaceae archaeon]